MSSEQSERIRAALLRSKAQQPSQANTIEAPEENATTPSLKASRQASASAPVESKPEKPEKPKPQEPAVSGVRTTASTAPAVEPPKAEVETTLPLVAASEKGRAALFPEAPRTIQSSEPAPASDRMPSWATAAVPGGPSRSRSLRIGLTVGGVLALVGLSAFLLRDHWRPAPKASATEAGSALQVQVEPEGNGVVNIRWNPQSGTVTQAREGRLMVTERDQPPRVIALNLDQLKIGRLFYQTSTDRVEFRLEVVSPSGAVSQESVLSVSPSAASAPQTVASTKQEPSKDTASSSAGPVATEAKQENSQTAPAQQAEPASRPAIRSFTPPPVSRKTNDASAVVLEPPAAVGSAPALPAAAGTLPEAVMPRLNQPPPPPQRIRIGGNLQAANLIKRVSPEYPPLAKSAGVEGVVRFTATIGKDGRIQNLQLVTGPPLLVNAATEAVKKWVYKPMLLDGDPVEVITQIDVNFALRK